MGKKSTGDFPYAYEEENKIPLSASPENIKQLDDYLQREEMSKHLLQLLEGNENKSAHFSKGGLPWHTRNSWETDDSSSWKDVSRTRCVSAFLTVTFCSKVAYQLCPTSALSWMLSEVCLTWQTFSNAGFYSWLEIVSHIQRALWTDLQSDINSTGVPQVLVSGFPSSSLVVNIFVFPGTSLCWDDHISSKFWVKSAEPSWCEKQVCMQGEGKELPV